MADKRHRFQHRPHLITTAIEKFRFVEDVFNHHAPEHNASGGTLAVPVNNYFQLVCLGNVAGKIKWAVRHETGQPHPAR